MHDGVSKEQIATVPLFSYCWRNATERHCSQGEDRHKMCPASTWQLLGQMCSAAGWQRSCQVRVSFSAAGPRQHQTQTGT